MAMYYPQDVVIEMGPTGIRRGSHHQCYPNDYMPDRFVFTEQPQHYERSLTCRAGTVVLLHYEIIHRRMKNTLTDRFMMKLQFKRRVEPCEDSYLSNHFPSYDEVPVLDDNYDTSIDETARKIWDWLHNRKVYN